jgi:hypothetical protein
VLFDLRLDARTRASSLDAKSFHRADTGLFGAKLPGAAWMGLRARGAQKMNRSAFERHASNRRRAALRQDGQPGTRRGRLHAAETSVEHNCLPTDLARSCATMRPL